MRPIRSLFWILCLPAAHAQTPCGSPTGSDLIVGVISSVRDYTAIGGVDACMFGVSTCNLGTAASPCFSGSNQHPIHVQGLFRYEIVGGAGRFEQIGMSWASHDFYQLEQVLCCTCNPVGNGNLGPGCTTVSTPESQANQFNLGKRCVVNAFTGNFPWPLPSPGTTTLISERLQFLVADVDPAQHPGASFFAETAVVSPDDATAQHGGNNASHRPLSMTFGTDASFLFSGPTVREKAAIWAWKTIDPQVEVDVVQVPNEGVFLVGSRATDLGGGTWRYEYAVENVNSDASCGALHVPFALGVQPVNTAFHDVSYHDNDGPNGVPVDGTDWTPAIATNHITWATVPFNVNPSANGLRFATLYNFRFDAQHPPQLTTVTLDLWKSAGSVTANAFTPGGVTLPGVPYCFGDSSGTACPCANASAPGAMEGCLNSLGSGGRLVSTGQPSVSNDSLVLSGTQMTNSACLYFQGTTQLLGGAGIVFGDGLRCAGGTIVRIATRTNTSGASAYPSAGDPSVSVKGMCLAGDLCTYEVWYRNAGPFCTPATFNMTNGVLVIWSP